MPKLPKAKLAPRKAPDPSAVEAFIAGKPAPSTNDRADSPPIAPAPALESGRKVIERKDGRQLRRTTIYLEASLARRISVYAATHDMDQSTIIRAAVESWLTQHSG